MSHNIGKNQNKLSFLCINTRSVLPKVDDLLLLLSQIPVKIIALTETWLSPDTESQLNIPGYRVICKSRKAEMGGGIALIIREDIVYKLFSESNLPIHDSYERLFVTLPQEKGPDLLVGAIYRPPGLSLIDFNDNFAQLMSALDGNRRNIILLGDYNIDMLKINTHRPTMDFLNSLFSYFITPIINCPTRVTEDTMTLIDNVLTNMYDMVHEPTVLLSDISDHFPILLWLDIKGVSPEIGLPRKSISINEANVSAFCNSLKEMDWEGSRQAVDNNDTTLAYDLFINDYTTLYNKAFMVSNSRKTSNTPRKPWMTTGLLRSCKTKNKLYTRYKNSPRKIIRLHTYDIEMFSKN